jgi:hypothetical protein
MVNDVLDGHVRLDLQSSDRVYLHGYLGQLQVSGQVVQAPCGTTVFRFRPRHASPTPTTSRWCG